MQSAEESCFWTVVLEKTLESHLDRKEIKTVNPKGNQPWIFIGRTDAEAEVPILCPPDAKNRLIGKDPDCWERLRAGGEEGDRGWDGWMTSLIQRAWTWDREAWHAAVDGVGKSWPQLGNGTSPNTQKSERRLPPSWLSSTCDRISLHQCSLNEWVHAKVSEWTSISMPLLLHVHSATTWVQLGLSWFTPSSPHLCSLSLEYPSLPLLPSRSFCWINT